jgi:hypothetical protein
LGLRESPRAEVCFFRGSRYLEKEKAGVAPTFARTWMLLDRVAYSRRGSTTSLTEGNLLISSRAMRQAC